MIYKESKFAKQFEPKELPKDYKIKGFYPLIL